MYSFLGGLANFPEWLKDGVLLVNIGLQLLLLFYRYGQNMAIKFSLQAFIFFLFLIIYFPLEGLFI
jgi:hypothetical protein